MHRSAQCFISIRYALDKCERISPSPSIIQTQKSEIEAHIQILYRFSVLPLKWKGERKVLHTFHLAPLRRLKYERARGRKNVRIDPYAIHLEFRLTVLLFIEKWSM